MTDETNYMSMDWLLKKAYTVHKSGLKEANNTASHFRNQCSRLREKVQELEIEKLNTDSQVRSHQHRSGSCSSCENLRQTIQIVSQQYKELLDSKDNRIKQLERETQKYRRRLNISDSLDISLDQDLYKPRTVVTSSRLPDHSPDSTSRATPKSSLATPLKNEPISDEEACLVMEREDQREGHNGPKFRLQRKRNQRDRYTEDISPELKRARQISPQSVDQPSTSTTNTEPTHKSSHKLFVPDTVFPDLDTSIVSEGFHVDHDMETDHSHNTCGNKHERKSLKRNGKGKQRKDSCETVTTDFDETVLVVPETLAMMTEYVGDDDDSSDDEINQANDDISKPNAGKQNKGAKYNPQLSGIAEASCDITDEVTNSDDGENEILQYNVIENKQKSAISESPKSVKNKSKLSEPTKHAARSSSRTKGDASSEYSLRDMLLDSPGFNKEDDGSKNAIKGATYHQSLTLSGASFVNDSDREGDIDPTEDEIDLDETYKSQKISKSKSYSIKNVCSTMKEVNELFETPVAKAKKTSGVNDMNSDINETTINTKGKKPLFKKKKLEENDDMILRRSPRKHNPVIDNKLSKVSKSNLTKRIMKEEPKIEDKALDDNDLTVAPDQASDDRDENNLTENQSVEIYNVMPVQNGVPVSTKMFQVKTKHKKNTNDPRILLEEEKLVNLLDETLNSPSILSHKEKKMNARSNVNDVITISSPSVGSLSDPESPLLLKNDTKHKKALKAADISDNEWKSKSIMKRNTSSRSSRSNQSQGHSPEISTRNKKLNISKDKQSTGSRNKVYTMSVEPNDCDENTVSPKNFRQTTMTQAFFSPKRKNSKKSLKMIDNALEEAIKLSLEEAERSQNSVTIDDEDVECLEDVAMETKSSFPFKKPEQPVKRDLRARKSKKNFVKETINLDDTFEDEVNNSHILQEVKDQRSNIQGADQGQSLDVVSVGQGQRLNGSLDPAVELSQWCREPGTLATEGAEFDVKSLPSLDTDFRIEDLRAGSQSLPRTSTLVEDSQDIPCSSRSYKFGPRKKLTGTKGENSQDIENMAPPAAAIDDSFDRRPKIVEDKIAHVAVVRKRDERQKLQGHDCKQCQEYYKSAGLSDHEIAKHKQQCSRHRAAYAAPDTPPHYWSVGFIDTQECVDRGYLQIENKDDQDPNAPTHRRRRKFNKYFKSKNETTQDGDSEEDLEF